MTNRAGWWPGALCCPALRHALFPPGAAVRLQRSLSPDKEQDRRARFHSVHYNHSPVLLPQADTPTFPSYYKAVGLPWWLSGKESACQCRRLGFNPWVRKIPLEKEMATHSSILAWRIPWTEEPGGLQSMGLQRMGYD